MKTFGELIVEEHIKNNHSGYISTNESEDVIKSKYGDYKRGIDSIKPGLMFVLQLTSFMDNDFIDTKIIKTKELRKKKTEQIIKDAAKMPAIILSKTQLPDGWPVYDVAFWSKSNIGEGSGMMILKKICIWRYFGKERSDWEGIPPKWFLNMWREIDKEEKIEESEIKVKDLFYIKNEEEKYF